MPNTGHDDLSVAQMACTRVSLEPIARFDGDSAAQVVLNSNFESVVQAAVGDYRYGWARVEIILYPDPNPPLQRFDTAFLLPGDCVEVNEFRVNDNPTGYHRYNQYLFVDSDPDQSNVLIYTFRPITSQWPSTFTNGVAWKLAAMLLSSVKEDPSGAKDLEAIGEMQLQRAQFADSSGQTAGGFDLSNPRRVRRGGAPLRRPR